MRGRAIASRSLEPMPRVSSYLDSMLNSIIPVTQIRVARPSSRRDEYFHYGEGPCVSNTGVMQYWRAREDDWPQLASMAFDFLAVPAMSSECERVFSSLLKQTTPEGSRLSGAMLWHQECLSNWHCRGTVNLESCNNPVLLDLRDRNNVYFYTAIWSAA